MNVEIPFKFPEQAQLIPWEEIDFKGRGREDYGDVESLKDSILRYGLIQCPLVVANPDGERPWKLNAGGRRMTAMRLINPSHYPVMTREQVDEGMAIEMELIENTDRKSLKWQEQALLIKKAHDLYKAKHIELGGDWGSHHTGKLMGCSQAHVSHALHVATYLLNGDTDIHECASIGQAYQVLLKRRESHGDNLMATQAKKNLIKKVSKPMPTNASIDVRGEDYESDIFNLDSDASALDDLSGIKNEDDNTFFADATEFPLSEWLTLGDSVGKVLPSVPDNSFDHIITDPPYGIDMKVDFLVNNDTIIDTHDKQENISMFPEMIKQFYRTLRPGGYCCFWYDIEHHQLLRDLCLKEGFKVQMHQVVWVKTHSCKNQIAQINFTKQHETCMICRKGNAALEIPGQSSIIVADGATEIKMYSNPFAKPYKVWKHLIEAVSKQGQTIADPFAGQMSCPKAAVNLGRIPWACEIDQKHFDRGIVLMKETIDDITNGNAVYK